MLTYERAHALFEYSMVSGRLYRRADQSPVGSADPDYKGGLRFRVKVDGVKYLVHRVIWLMVTGDWPKERIDHRDGVSAHNWWLNLRDATAQINAQNQRRPRSNKVGGLPLGVTLVSPGKPKPYRSAIKVNDRRISLGFYATAEEAHQTYLAAKREHHEGCEI